MATAPLIRRGGLIKGHVYEWAQWPPTPTAAYLNAQTRLDLFGVT